MVGRGNRCVVKDGVIVVCGRVMVGGELKGGRGGGEAACMEI